MQHRELAGFSQWDSHFGLSRLKNNVGMLEIFWNICRNLNRNRPPKEKTSWGEVGEDEEEDQVFIAAKARSSRVSDFAILEQLATRLRRSTCSTRCKKCGKPLCRPPSKRRPTHSWKRFCSTWIAEWEYKTPRISTRHWIKKKQLIVCFNFILLPLILSFAPVTEQHDPHELATMLFRALMNEQGRDLMHQNREKVRDRLICTIKCGKQIPNAVQMEQFFDVVVHDDPNGTTLNRCFNNFTATSIFRKNHGCKTIKLYSKKAAEFPKSFIVAIHRPSHGHFKSLTECQVPEWIDVLLLRPRQDKRLAPQLPQRQSGLHGLFPVLHVITQTCCPYSLRCMQSRKFQKSVYFEQIYYTPITIFFKTICFKNDTIFLVQYEMLRSFAAEKGGKWCALLSSTFNLKNLLARTVSKHLVCLILKFC